jgi:cation transport regulator ChaB
MYQVEIHILPDSDSKKDDDDGDEDHSDENTAHHVQAVAWSICKSKNMYFLE